MRWKILFIIFLISYITSIPSLLNGFNLKELLFFIIGTIDIVGFYSFAFNHFLFTKKFWFYFFIFSILFVSVRTLFNFTSSYNAIISLMNNRS